MRARSTCSIPLKDLHTDFWSTSECQRPGAHKQQHVVMNVARVWPARSQHHATMLQDVALKCCERLAGPLGVYSPSAYFHIGWQLCRVIM